MKKNFIFIGLLLLFICLFACEEAEEGVDDNCDIIIRNSSEFDLWIMIDGVRRGLVENDGFAKTMWDDIPEGRHLLEAFRDDNYSFFHCAVMTDYLDDGQDFNWYLYEDDEYGGTFQGDCD